MQLWTLIEMANLSKALVGILKDKVIGKSTDENVSSSKPSLSTKQLKIISKNFMSLSAMARDLNVASQNVKELVRVMGGKPNDKEDKVAGSGLTEEERSKKLDVLVEQEQKAEDLKPTKVETDKKTSFFQKMKKKGVDQFKKTKIGKKAIDLKNQFSDNKFIKAFKKYFAFAVIGSLIFLAFKDSIVEWAKELWSTIAEKFDEFVENIKNWFSEITTKIVDDLKEFINSMIETVSNFFGKIGNWFVEKFETIKEIFEPALNFVKKVWDKFMGYIDQFKTFLKPKVEGAMKAPLVGGAVTKFVQSLGIDKFLGIGKVEEKKVEKTEDDEKKKKEAADTERVRKQEEKAQYTGEDEIVRKRHGIEDKTATMRAEEAKKAQPVPKDALVTSEGKPVVSGSGQVITTTPTEEKPTPTPTPKVEAKPAPTPKVEAKPTPAPKVETKPAPSAAPPTAPSKEKKDEKPLEVSGIQATIIDSLKQSGINSPKAHANVLATVKAESNFKVQSENLNYSSPDRIQAVFGKRRIPSIEFAQQFVKNPEALANHVYKTTDGNSEPGDGFKYRGRGFIQHTGKNQYAAISKFTGVDVIKNPDALNSPEVAAKAIPWFLLSYKRMKPEDVSDMSKVNKAIAFADPTGQKALAREKSSEQIYASMSGSPGTQVASASSEVASGQRQQQKPSTPVVVNAPTTNTTVISKTQTASAPPPKNTANVLVARTA